MRPCRKQCRNCCPTRSIAGNNIRAAAVLGVVGAGGLGQMLYFHLSLFQMGETAAIVIAMFAIVLLVDALSYFARRRLTA